jgi:glycogen operon protein
VSAAQQSAEAGSLAIGLPAPIGARWTGEGVNFALFSAHAEQVELCLFDPVSGHETGRLPLPGRTGNVWHGFAAACMAGPNTLYGYRVHGPFEPRSGHRFNPRRLLIDPAALDLAGELRLSPAVIDDPDTGPRQPDSAAFMPRSRVVDTAFDWQGTHAPAVPWRDTVIYELHVKGFTRLHPQVPPEWRGKYLGLTVPAVLDHLRRLGITSVELLPCQAFTSEPLLVERGLSNYWGYNPIAWFAPARQYAVSDPVTEFKEMVRALHAAGIEVILDVVFNHTAEAGANGLTLSMKGIDNASYYRLDPADRSVYENLTGCGNTVNASHPQVRSLILECLRYWAREMQVDGFRFDLATVLARGREGFDPDSRIFAAIRSDPVLAYSKMIAEPWDLGPGGYRLGGFPRGWSEWNDRYRDNVRAFWRGDPAQVAGLAERLAGSSDLFRAGGRKPSASVNFVTAHDGFTLADLVSYNDRHNEANLEGNADGHRDNLSWNCGVEGPDDDPQVTALRSRQMRNILATLLLSQGVPMLQAGDEFARSQRGNNNAYCQDNELSWLAWPEAGAGREADTLAGFVASLLALRRRRPELRRDRFFKGSPREGRQPDVRWLHPAGRDMLEPDWTDPGLRSLGMLLGAESAAAGDLMILLSAADDDLEFALPEDLGTGWRVCLDSCDIAGLSGPADKSSPVFLGSRCILVLERS